jgi:hypothetical protein
MCSLRLQLPSATEKFISTPINQTGKYLHYDFWVITEVPCACYVYLHQEMRGWRRTVAR